MADQETEGKENELFSLPSVFLLVRNYCISKENRGVNV
jgi:hypothetical protein